MKSKSLAEVQRIVLKATMQFAIGGLILAAVILVILVGGIEGLSFIAFFPVSFALAFLGLAGSILLLSFLAAKLLHANKLRPVLAGLAMPLLSLVVTVLLGSLPMYFAEGLGIAGGFFDYIVKPFYWVMLVGTLPSLVIGLFLGLVIRDRLREREVPTEEFKG